MFGIRKKRGFYDDFEAGFGLCILGAPAGPAQAAVAGASGSAGCSLLFAIPPLEMLRLAVKPVTSWQPASVLLTLYLITFLQRILELRSQIRLAQEDLNRLFHNRRIKILGACLFIGLLPSAASMLLRAELVKNETDGCLSSRDQAFTASWLRHIPESALPTYTAVLLMLNLSGVETAAFLLEMLPPVLMLGAIGYLFCLRRIPARRAEALFPVRF